MMAEISLQCTPSEVDMKKIIGLISLAGIAVALLSACSTSTDPSDLYKDETEHQIYQKGKSALQDKSYSEATKRFEALSVQYPFGPETQNANLYIIYAYYQKEEFALASTAADKFIRTYPADPNVDYAYYMRGLADYYQNMGFLERIFAVDLATRDLTQLQKSFVDFKELVMKFPNSPYTPSAHQYLIYLRNIMADHELEVAQYYYTRKAYVAAANRASDVVAHYEGAPAVPKALVVMAQSYQALGLRKQEQDARAVLAYSYPGVRVES